MTLDPIELQVVTGALRAACEEMGAALIRSARSPNIKERRDCSTALFDARGQMVMQAEHIPVHLGSMPAAVAAVLDQEHFEGISWVLNDPFAGGTHLPDITLVTPVFTECSATGGLPTGNGGSVVGDAPTGTGISMAGDIPTGTGISAAGDIPTGTGIPAAGDIPTGTGISMAGDIPTGTGISAAGDIPTGTGISAAGDIPTGTGISAVGDIPTGIGIPAGEDTQVARGRLIGFAASRAHHADVGGRVPGSMPADSRTLAEEGVVIPPRPATPEAIEEIVAAMRQPDERRADLRAQLAANRIGALRLSELAARVSSERLREAFDAVLDYAERRTRACIAALPDGTRTARDVLEAIEGDLPLCLRATVVGERLILDFTGSAPQHAGNLNCPLSVTLSACYFAVRVLTDPDIPPSAGAYRPVEVRVPEGSLLNALPVPHASAPPGDYARDTPNPTGAGAGAPEPGTGGAGAGGPEPGEAPAVAAGNVETSSRVADLVLAAFGRALGQGTMNNLTLGDERFSYYETLGGGQGACSDADGPSGVHVAMSNTLNTPIEALERELPLRVTHYALRRGSGGAGVHRGGDGVVREIEALREMTFSLIAERRRHAPPGSHGGQPGARGRDLLLESGATGRELPGKVTGVLRPGERLRIETPGGGGDGTP